MRIVLDLRFTSRSAMGTGCYAQTMAEQLINAKEEGDRLIALGVEPGLPSHLASEIEYHTIPVGATKGSRAWLAERLLWDSWIENLGADVYFSPTGLGPRIKTCPVVITIHDLNFEEAPEHYGPDLLRFLKAEIPRSVHTAELVIAISEFTKRQLISFYGVREEKIRIVHQPLSSFSRKWSVGVGEYATVPVPDNSARPLLMPWRSLREVRPAH